MRNFKTAIEIFRRYHVELEEAAVLMYWSRVLFAAEQHRQSAEKFNAAFAILRASYRAAMLRTRLRRDLPLLTA